MNIPSPLARLRDPVLDQQAVAALWERIATTHQQRVRRRRWQRFGAASVLAASLLAAVALFHPLRFESMRDDEPVNWQARAQALELQLAVLQSEHAASVASVGVTGLESELAEIDARLRSAYELGPSAEDIAPLWKRRSELLDTLLASRKQGLALTHI